MSDFDKARELLEKALPIIRWADGRKESLGYLTGEISYFLRDHPPTGNQLPPHLREDAPLRYCNQCGRTTVAIPAGEVCGMIQPSGVRCTGRFREARP